MIAIDWGSATAVGANRAHNEDNLLTSTPVFIVADGMGGHAGGEVASGLVVDEFRRLSERGPIGAADVLASLARANDAVLAAAGDEGRSGMGTTVVGLTLVEEGGAEYWMAFNVGDSRLYRCFGGTLEQLSVDHSEVQQLIDGGHISADEVRHHPRRNVLTRAIGTDPGPAPNYCLRFPTAGERFLLCSDGVSVGLGEDELLGLLTVDEPAAVLARRFVTAARAAGGTDDSTAIVVDVGAVASDDADESTQPRSGTRG